MSIAILGSVAFDTLATKEGRKEKIMGGSAFYSAIAASNFTKVGIISVVGQDYPQKYFDILTDRGIDISDILIEEGSTFHWEGSYINNMNMAETVKTELGVLETFKPRVSGENVSRDILFLANNDPSAQLAAIKQSKPQLVALDTMNLWIDIKLAELEKAISHVDYLFINDAEIKQFTGEDNLVVAPEILFEKFSRLKYVLLKKGEFGSTIVGRNSGEYFSVGAYPLKVVKDPTGAGDSFAGSFLGYLADKEQTWGNLKQALLIGTTTSSYTVGEFGPDNLLGADKNAIDKRFFELKEFTTL